jgi:hypothetical protein
MRKEIMVFVEGEYQGEYDNWIDVPWDLPKDRWAHRKTPGLWGSHWWKNFGYGHSFQTQRDADAPAELKVKVILLS